MLYDFGDRVVIKSWDEMADQYPAGIERIRMPVYDFVNNMEQWCEEVLQIRNVLSDHYTMYGCSGYCFTDDMIRCKAPCYSMVTHKYSVGDKVLVLSDPDRMRDFDVGINDDMLAKCGTVVTIESRTNWRDSYITYHIEEDRWTWDEGMFEGLFAEKDICDGDISDFNPVSII